MIYILLVYLLIHLKITNAVKIQGSISASSLPKMNLSRSRSAKSGIVHP